MACRVLRLLPSAVAAVGSPCFGGAIYWRGLIKRPDGLFCTLSPVSSCCVSLYPVLSCCLVLHERAGVVSCFVLNRPKRFELCRKSCIFVATNRIRNEGKNKIRCRPLVAVAVRCGFRGFRRGSAVGCLQRRVVGRGRLARFLLCLDGRFVLLYVRRIKP